MLGYQAGDLVWYVFVSSVLHLIFRRLGFISVILIIFRSTSIFVSLGNQSGILKWNLKKHVVQYRILGDTDCLVSLKVLIDSAEARSQAAHLSQAKRYLGRGFLWIQGFFQLDGCD
jgi:hypothetical protein